MNELAVTGLQRTIDRHLEQAREALDWGDVYTALLWMWELPFWLTLRMGQRLRTMGAKPR